MVYVYYMYPHTHVLFSSIVLCVVYVQLQEGWVLYYCSPVHEMHG